LRHFDTPYPFQGAEMVEKTDEPTILAADFGGMNRDTDIHDLPFGKFRVSRNSLTSGANNKKSVRHRDGLMPVTFGGVERIFDAPFAIIPGAPGGQSQSMITKPETEPPYGDYALQLVATPNDDLHASAANPIDVTFTVYGGAALGISSYSWDFSYDGVTPNADDSGASTSAVNQYTAEGTYRVRVWGTGGDSKEYNSTLKLTILPYGEGAPAPSDPPDAPIEEPPDEPIETPPPTVTLLPEAQTITSGDTANLTYNATDAVTVYFYDEDGVETELDNAVGGHVPVTPTTTSTYSILAINGTGTATAYATITVDMVDVVPGYMKVAPQLPKVDYDSMEYFGAIDTEAFDIVVTCYEKDTGKQAAFPAGYDPILIQNEADPADVVFATVSPTMSGDRLTATFEDVTLTLGATATGLVDVKARVVDVYPEIEDKVSDKILAYAPTVELVVNTVDVNAGALSEIETIYNSDTDQVTATFYLEIEAQPVGGGATVTTWNGNVKLSDVISDAFAEVNPAVVFADVTGEDTYADETGTPITIGDDKIIPGSVFLAGDAGYVTVRVTVTFPGFSGAANYAKAKYVAIDFAATEVVSG